MADEKILSLNVQKTRPYPESMNNPRRLDPEPQESGRLAHTPQGQPLTLQGLVEYFEQQGIHPADVTLRGGSLHWTVLETEDEARIRFAEAQAVEARVKADRRRQYEALKAEFEEEPEPAQGHVCLRCEVRIYQHLDGGWRGLISDSPICWRNPAQDGHEPRPTP